MLGWPWCWGEGWAARTSVCVRTGHPRPLEDMSGSNRKWVPILEAVESLGLKLIHGKAAESHLVQDDPCPNVKGRNAAIWTFCCLFIYIYICLSACLSLFYCFPSLKCIWKDCLLLKKQLLACLTMRNYNMLVCTARDKLSWASGFSCSSSWSVDDATGWMLES